MQVTIRYSTTAIAGAALAASLIAPAQAKEYNYSIFIGPDHMQTVHAAVPWVDGIKARTNGEIDFQVFAGGVLLPPVGVLKGLKEGVADGGFVTAGYVPAEMPIWNAIGDLGWLAPDEMLIAFAATEFGMLDPDGMADWVNNDVVFLGATTTPVYHFMCKGSPTNLADFKGLRIRTPGNVWARFAETIEGISVNIPSNEAYSGLERGALDCVNFTSDQVTTGPKIGEVIDSINMLTMGPFFTQSPYVLNENFWNSITPEQRQIVLEESAKGIVNLQVELNGMVAKAEEDAKANGIEFIEPSADLQAALDQFLANDLGGLHQMAKDRGVPNSDRVLDSFSKLVAKWQGLLQGVDRTDKAALTQLLMTEVYSKVDMSTYGLQ